MNATLRKFGYPDTLIREYGEWVVMIRPKQITFGCVVMAAKSDGTSFGDLLPQAAVEFPKVVRDFEATLRALAHADKFNYLGLMMVDPNPHFHAIPRYAQPVSLHGLTLTDALFPKPPDLNVGNELETQQLGLIRRLLIEHWHASAR